MIKNAFSAGLRKWSAMVCEAAFSDINATTVAGGLRGGAGVTRRRYHGLYRGQTDARAIGCEVWRVDPHDRARPYRNALCPEDRQR